MTPKGSVKLKDLMTEAERHAIRCREASFKYFSTSKDGNWETYTCSICGAAVTVPVGAK
jgi:hypothetical protein